MGSSSAPGLSLLLAAAISCAAAGCGNANLRDGDALFKAGSYDAAADAYRRAMLEERGDASIGPKLDEAERLAALDHRENAKRRDAAGDLPGAQAELEAAFRRNPDPELAALRDAARAKCADVRGRIEAAKALVDGGKPLGISRAITTLLPYRAGFPELDALAARALGAEAAALRERAHAALAAGQVAAANEDLAEAGRIDELRGRIAAQSDAGPGPGGEGRAGRAGPDGKSAAGAPSTVPAGAPSTLNGAPSTLNGAPSTLDDYARAAADVQRIAADLPRRRPGGGIPKPDDYAMSDADLAALDDAVGRSLRAKPTTEKMPTWLAHGKVVLRMGREVAALRRVALAKERADAGDAAGAWVALGEARRLDPEILTDPEPAASADAVRAVIARRLLKEAEHEAEAGHGGIARLRLRQAREVGGVDAAAAARVEERAAAASAVPAVVLMPFQSYAQAPGIADRLQARLTQRLTTGGRAGPVLAYETYRQRKESGRLPPLAGIIRGDIMRLESRDPTDPAAAQARVATYRSALEEARRRLASAEDVAARTRAQATVDETERALARAERERAAAAATTARPAAGGARIAMTIELRYQLHDPAVGRDLVAEPVVRSIEGAKGKAAEIEQQLLDDAAEPIAAAIEARFFDLARGAQQETAADPRKGLDAMVRALESAPAEAADRASAEAVLEATGWSFNEGRTLPERLRLEGAP